MKNKRIETRLESIPAPIAAALRELLRQTRKIILTRGLCAVAIVFIGLALLVMGADMYFTIISASTRWILSCIIYAGTAIAIYKFIVSPLARSYTLAGMALMIESHHPEMQERLSSAVELLTSSDDPGVRGSQKLIDALAEAAADDARKIRPKKEISIRAAIPYLSAGLGAFLLLAAIFAVSPDKTSFLLTRAMAPFANLPNISAMDLEVRPGDVFVSRGKSLEISLVLSKSKIRSAKIRRTMEDGSVTIDEMKKLVSSGKENMHDFIFKVDSVERNFIYRIEAEDAVTKYYKVTAVTPPVMEKIALRIDYPEYAGTAPLVEPESEGTLIALVGSVATISIEINKACQFTALKVDAQNSAIIHPEKTAGANGGRHLTFRVPLTPGLLGTYSILLADEYGLTNTKFERPLQALPDMPPVAVITDISQKEIHLKSGDHFPLYFFATDDMGLSSLELLLEKDSAVLAPVKIVIPATAISGNGCAKKFEGSMDIDLAEPSLRGAKRVMFQIMATDNLPRDLKGPQRGFSEKYTIVIDENVKFFEGQALQTQKDVLKELIDKAKTELEQAKQNLASVKEVSSKNEKKPEQISERVATLRENLEKSDSTLKKLSEALSDGFLNKVSGEIGEIRREEISKAQGLADQMALTETPEERNILAEDIGKHIEKSRSALDELFKKTELSAKALDLALQMRNLAETQENMAKQKMEIDRKAPPVENTAATDNPEMKKQLDEWRREQSKIADSAVKMAKENVLPESLKDSKILDEAERISNEARQLAVEQSRLTEKFGKISKLQDIDKRIGELSVQQSTAAEFAKSSDLTLPASEAMKNAAERISDNKLDEAAPKQNDASATLGETVARMEKEGAGDPWKRTESPSDALKEISAKANKSGELAASAAEKAKASDKATQAELEKFERATKDAGKNVDKAALAIAAEKTALLKELVQKSKEASAKSEQSAREAQNLAKEASAVGARFNPNSTPAEKGALLDQAEQKARDAEQKAIIADNASKVAESAAKIAADLANGRNSEGYNSEPVRSAMSQSEKAAEAAKAVNDAIPKATKSLEETAKNIAAMEKFRNDVQKNLQKELAAEIGEKIASARREEAMAKHALDGARNAANAAKQAADQAVDAAKSASTDQNMRNAAGRAIESTRKSLESAQQSKLADSLLAELASDERSARQEIVGELAKVQNSLNDKTIELMREKNNAADARKRDQMDELEKRQAELMEEAKGIAALAAKESSKSAEQAKDSAVKTKDSLRNSDLASAAVNAAETSRSLGELAKGLEAEAVSHLEGKDDKDKGGSPASDLAMRARKAEQEQDMIRKEISALAGDNPLEQLAAWQANIESRAEELKKDAESLKTSSKELNLPPKSQQLATEGEQNLQNAYQNSDNAVKTIAKMREEVAKAKQSPVKSFSEKLSGEAMQAQALSSKSLEQAAAKMAELAGKKSPDEEKKNSEIINEVGRIADEARKLADEQSRLEENVKKIPQMQNIEKRIGELYKQQSLAAEFAKSNNLTAPAGDTMKNAAERISDNKLDEAARRQNDASATLGEAVARLEKEAAGDPWKTPDSPRDALKEMSAKANKSGEMAASAAEEAKSAEKDALAEINKFERDLKEDAGKKVDKAAAAAAAEKTPLLKELAQKVREASAKSEQNALDAQNLAKEVSAAESRFNPGDFPDEKSALLEQAEQKTRAAEQKAIFADNAAEVAKSAAKMASDLAKSGKNPGEYQSEPVSNAMLQSGKAADAVKAANDEIAKMAKSLGETAKNIAAMEKFQKDAEKNSYRELASEIGEKLASARRDEAMAKRALDDAGKATTAAKQAADQARQYSDAASKNPNKPNAIVQSAEAVRKSLESEQQSELAENLLSKAASDERSAQQEIIGELAKTQKSLNDKTMKFMKEKEAVANANMQGQAAELEKRQGSIAEEAKNIAALVAEESPASGKSAEQAKDSAKKTKDSLGNSDLPSATANAVEAAKNLGELAKELEAASKTVGKNDKDKKNSPVSDLAMRARKATQEQEMIRKEISALAENKPLDQLAAWQDSIATRAEKLRKDTEAFSANARKLEIPQENQQSAAKSGNDLKDASRNSDNAGKSIAKMAKEAAQMKQAPEKTFSEKLPAETMQSQASASKSLEQAASIMDGVKNEMSADSNPDTAQESIPDLPMASGLARKASLGLEQNPVDAIRSAEALKSVAQNAMNEAEKAGANTRPSKITALQSGAKTVSTAAKEEPKGFEQIGKRMKLSYDDWLRLPANLRSEILQSSSNEGPEEYRDIIKRYFEELSKLGMEGK